MATKTLVGVHFSVVLSKTSIDNGGRPLVFRPSFIAR